jgi:hypothetical protein
VTGQEIVDEAWRDFERWLAEQDDDIQELRILEQAVLYDSEQDMKEMAA